MCSLNECSEWIVYRFSSPSVRFLFSEFTLASRGFFLIISRFLLLFQSSTVLLLFRAFLSLSSSSSKISFFFQWIGHFVKHSLFLLFKPLQLIQMISVITNVNKTLFHLFVGSSGMNFSVIVSFQNNTKSSFLSSMVWSMMIVLRPPSSTNTIHKHLKAM